MLEDTIVENIQISFLVLPDIERVTTKRFEFRVSLSVASPVWAFLRVRLFSLIAWQGRVINLVVSYVVT